MQPRKSLVNKVARTAGIYHLIFYEFDDIRHTTVPGLPLLTGDLEPIFFLS